MSDETFERFRHELADATTRYALRGEFGPYSGRCPLGCHQGSIFPCPGVRTAAELWGIPIYGAEAFIVGFDVTGRSSDGSAYYDLGVLYRRRFDGWRAVWRVV